MPGRLDSNAIKTGQIAQGNAPMLIDPFSSIGHARRSEIFSGQLWKAVIEHESELS
jgi:hypothetical protein